MARNKNSEAASVVETDTDQSELDSLLDSLNPPTQEQGTQESTQESTQEQGTQEQGTQDNPTTPAVEAPYVDKAEDWGWEKHPGVETTIADVPILNVGKDRIMPKGTMFLVTERFRNSVTKEVRRYQGYVAGILPGHPEEAGQEYQIPAAAISPATRGGKGKQSQYKFQADLDKIASTIWAENADIPNAKRADYKAGMVAMKKGNEKAATIMFQRYYAGATQANADTFLTAVHAARVGYMALIEKEKDQAIRLRHVQSYNAINGTERTVITILRNCGCQY